MPWRETNDPYRILVSEVMLQQTRAQTVIPYYRRFLERFPDARALADAPEADVLAEWSGLGYYSRARNLQKAAAAIARQKQFPREYEQIRELPGVGPYTAAAVASIAFGLPHAVVDGNVLRIVARLCGDPADIRSSKTLARFQHIADEWLDRRDPGLFNQAMMELGATICLPRNPQCSRCPAADFCVARQNGREHELPIRGRKRPVERIGLQVVIVAKKGSILLRQRAATESLMSGFWELPAPQHLPGWRGGKKLGSFRHTITHHRYTITVLTGRVAATPPGFRWQVINRLAASPITTITRKALKLMASAQQDESGGLW